MRYIGGGVFEIAWYTRARPPWIVRHARETDLAGAARFVRRWGIEPHRLLAIDLGIAPPLTRRE